MVDDNILLKARLDLVSNYGDIASGLDIAFELFNLIDKKCDNKEDIIYLKEKAAVCQQKLKMMIYAEKNANDALKEFECTQNMDCPALSGDDEIKILFYIESTIIFARNALDVVATIFNRIVFNNRNDSFNDFNKKARKEKEKCKKLIDYFEKWEKIETHPLGLLCGDQKGRALRDQIIHQMNIKIEYDEYRENSEKEKLHVILNKDFNFPYDLFMPYFVFAVIDMIKTIIGVIS